LASEKLLLEGVFDAVVVDLPGGSGFPSTSIVGSPGFKIAEPSLGERLRGLCGPLNTSGARFLEAGVNFRLEAFSISCFCS
jgi:hypothetical protein